MKKTLFSLFAVTVLGITACNDGSHDVGPKVTSSQDSVAQQDPVFDFVSIREIITRRGQYIEQEKDPRIVKIEKELHIDRPSLYMFSYTSQEKYLIDFLIQANYDSSIQLVANEYDNKMDSGYIITPTGVYCMPSDALLWWEKPGDGQDMVEACTKASKEKTAWVYNTIMEALGRE